jgi:hypothetical protein
MIFLRSNDLDVKMTIRPEKTIFKLQLQVTPSRRSYVSHDNADVALDRKAYAAAEILAARDARLCAERSRLAQIADWCQSGETLNQIGSRPEVSDVTILRWMTMEGISRRKRYGGRRSYAVAGNVCPASSRRRGDNPEPDHHDGPLLLLQQRRWTIAVARERKQGMAGVQDGAGGVQGTAGGFAERAAVARAILYRAR